MPGDKSISHRALLLAARAEGRSRLSGLSTGEDVAAHRRRHPGLRRRGDNRIRWRASSSTADPPASESRTPRSTSATRGPVSASWPGGPRRSMASRCCTAMPRSPAGPWNASSSPLRSMGARIDGRHGGRLPPLVGPRRRIARNRLPPPGAERPGQRSRSPRRAGRRGADDGARGRADPAAHRGAAWSCAAPTSRPAPGSVTVRAVAAPALRSGRSRRPVPGRLLDRGGVHHPGERTDGGSRVRRPRTSRLPGRAAPHGRRHRGRRRGSRSPTRPASSPDTVRCTPPTSAARRCRR